MIEHGLATCCGGRRGYACCTPWHGGHHRPGSHKITGRSGAREGPVMPPARRGAQTSLLRHQTLTAPSWAAPPSMPRPHPPEHCAAGRSSSVHSPSTPDRQACLDPFAATASECFTPSAYRWTAASLPTSCGVGKARNPHGLRYIRPVHITCIVYSRVLSSHSQHVARGIQH
jgi:hypothetical protein